jgi:hypothetical protein
MTSALIRLPAVNNQIAQVILSIATIEEATDAASICAGLLCSTPVYRPT